MRPLALLPALMLLTLFAPTTQAAATTAQDFDKACLDAMPANATANATIDCEAAIPAGYENATPAQFEKMFLRRAILHHQGALMMSQMASSKAQHDALKAFAQNASKNESAQIANMTAWLQAWYGFTPPDANRTGLMQAMKAKSANLTSASGAAFDMELLDAMIAHDTSGIASANAAKSRVAHNETKSFLAALVDAQQKDLSLMQGWRATWSASGPSSANNSTTPSTPVVGGGTTPSTATTTISTTPRNATTTPSESSGGGRTPAAGLLLVALAVGVVALALRQRRA